jgi:VanZ family protein
VLAYVSLIFFVSSRPHLRTPLKFRNADKLAHVVEYGGLGVLAARALGSTARFHGALRGGSVALVLGMAVGASDEVFQAGIPGRESSVFDFLADSTGLILALLLYLALRRD